MIAFLRAAWRVRKLFALVAGASFLFGLGWKVQGWRLQANYRKVELQRETELRLALEANAAWLVRVNQGTEEREAALLIRLEDARRQSDELREQINAAPVVKTVTVERTVAGECPPTPTVDWRVFRELYNRAAIGATQASASGSSDAGVSAGSPNVGSVVQ